MDQTKSTLTFDVSGTLLDWHSAMSQAFSEVSPRLNKNIDPSALTVEYHLAALHAIISQVNPEYNFDTVLSSELNSLLERHSLVVSPADRQHLLTGWNRVKSWPDVAEGFAKLRSRHRVVAFSVLSTVQLMEVSRANGLIWDALFSCEMIGVYKTTARSYDIAAKWLGIPANEIIMVACHGFDLDAAAACGYRTALVRRPHEYGPETNPYPSDPSKYDFVADSFDDLARQLE
ncbi:haloacid dehalogenase type II [Gluconacetobacter sacchari]|uniref:haloacid dehalogenase type II n=1 Tax=Gluconacetobacter sacchari TaxID=92759 RepID=UPI0039B60152